jgi:hypothetical protein
VQRWYEVAAVCCSHGTGDLRMYIYILASRCHCPHSFAQLLCMRVFKHMPDTHGVACRSDLCCNGGAPVSHSRSPLHQLLYMLPALRLVCSIRTLPQGRGSAAACASTCCCHRASSPATQCTTATMAPCCEVITTQDTAEAGCWLLTSQYCVLPNCHHQR